MILGRIVFWVLFLGDFPIRYTETIKMTKPSQTNKNPNKGNEKGPDKGTEKGKDRNPILVVDDDISALNFICGILRRSGYSFATANSAVDAIRYLDQRMQSMGALNIAGIISDWQMPVHDGVWLLQQVRENAKVHIPFILISGALTKEELAKAAQNKADGLLLKPLREVQLSEKIASLMKKDA